MMTHNPAFIYYFVTDMNPGEGEKLITGLYDRSFIQPDFFHELNIPWVIAQVLQTWFHLQVSY